MKVAVLTSYFPTSNRPWEGRSAYETLRLLNEHCEVEVFCPVATYPLLLTPRRVADPPIDLSWRPQGVSATYIKYPALPVISRSLNGSSIARRLLPSIRSFRPDILLNYMIYPDGYAAIRIGRTLQVPVVLTAIGSDLNRPGNLVCTKLTKYALKHASLVVTVSQDLAKTAVSLGASPEQVRAIRNGCDPDIFQPQDRALARKQLALDVESPIIVYIGRLDLRKGLIELVKAMAQLHKDSPLALCYIIGQGSDESFVRQAIESMDASAYITLVPPVTTSQVATWIAASTLVTLPSYNEGCPNVIVESLAAGRPVVATNVGGIPELVDHTCGRLVPPEDVPSLTKALGDVLNHTWSAANISTNHKRSWADVKSELLNVLSTTTDTSRYDIAQRSQAQGKRL